MNGYLFPKEDIGVLTKLAFQLISNGKLTLVARNAASMGRLTAKNLLASESVVGYASLLENILMLPSEVSIPQVAKEIPVEFKAKWQWRYFEYITDIRSPNRTGRIYELLSKVEKQFNRTRKENSRGLITTNDTYLYDIWEEQKYVDIANMRKRREDEEVSDFGLFLYCNPEHKKTSRLKVTYSEITAVEG